MKKLMIEIKFLISEKLIGIAFDTMPDGKGKALLAAFMFEYCKLSINKNKL